MLDLLQHRGHAITARTLRLSPPWQTPIPSSRCSSTIGKPSSVRAPMGWRGWTRRPSLTGRVHADYLQLGSRAGRMSCTTPNIQNLPRSKTYRGCITAEPGSCIVKADYSQIELRIAAVIAQDAAMLEAYRNGQDLHTTTAARLLSVVPERVTSESRQLAKAVNFGPFMGWVLPGSKPMPGNTTASASPPQKLRSTASAFLRPTPACGTGTTRRAPRSRQKPAQWPDDGG